MIIIIIGEINYGSLLYHKGIKTIEAKRCVFSLIILDNREFN